MTSPNGVGRRSGIETDEHFASVSFVLYRTPIDEICRALNLVRASAAAPRIFLVDNSVPPIDMVGAGIDLTGIDVIVMGWNAGYGRGHNAAIRRSGARYHAVLNTDISFTDDVLTRLIGFMEERPTVGLVAPRVTYPDGRIQHLCRLLPSPVDIMARALFGGTAWAERINRRYEVRDWSYDRVAQFPFLSGCFMVFRRSALDRVGGFDERFFMYAEDIDITRRIGVDAETLFVPDVTIVHDYRSQSGFSLRRQRTRFVNLARYFMKWGWIFDRDRRRINRQTLDALR